MNKVSRETGNQSFICIVTKNMMNDVSRETYFQQEIG